MAKVYFRHLRALDYCKDGLLLWCQRYNISKRVFFKGIDSDELRKVGCPLANKAADLADREGSDGR
ncbi:hypothetical protein [Neptuniibacter sp.]|uniref:hypothetical protein n=1 Tax=Neptuniibacter sp. TaxID=1962643 RepID=UPI003B5B91B3